MRKNRRSAAVLFLALTIFLLPARKAAAQSIGITVSGVMKPVKQDMNERSVTNWYRTYSGNSTIELKLLSSRTDRAGNIHYKYRQYYQAIPVEHSMLNIHTGKDGIYAMNGNIFPTEGITNSPTMSAEAALNIALQQIPSVRYAWQDSSMQTLLRETENNAGASHYPVPFLCYLPEIKEQGILRLAYRLDIYSLDPLQKKRFYIDALNGNILREEELLHHIDRTGIAHTLYSGIKSITCDSISPSQFYLTETKRGGGIATYNAQKNVSATTIKFSDNDNVWNNVNADRDEVATDLHWGLEMTYDYYKTKLLRNSYDDKGHKLTAMAHTGINYNNAHFDGTTAFFGDGDNITDNPWVSVDMCGHEISHGLTKETADLYYLDEMGALNESFSDIFGKCVEYYYGTAFNWKIGSTIKKSGSGVRDMKNPNATNFPKYYKGKHYYSGTLDYGGVHTNSNVQNFWFYLLCEGGTGTRESDGEAYTVKPIGLAKAEQIAYSNLADYLFPLAQYKDAAKYSLEAAAALYGITSEAYKQTEAAWYAVGVIDKPVSIKTLHSTPEYSVFPNPAKDKVTIEFGYSLINGNIRLCDITGRQLFSADTVKGERFELDILNLQPGFYWLNIRYGAQSTNVRLIKL